MKHFILFSIFMLIFFTSFSQEERKFIIWNKNDVSLQPIKGINLEIAEKVHYSPKLNSVELKYAELFVSHQPKKWCEYGGGFRLSEANTHPGWLQENRLMLFFDLLENFHDYKFKFSNRMEYRDFVTGKDYFRHRQSLTVNFPSVTPLHLYFYLTEESFYKLNGIGLHMARFYSGVTTFKKEHFNVKLYYALEKTKQAAWNSTDIAGINLNFIL